MTEVFRGEVFEDANLNFTLEPLKKILTFYDTANGEVPIVSYQNKITVTKENGSRQIFVGTVEGNKVKNFEWVIKATHSLATIPKSKEEKKSFEHMVQVCIEADNVEIEYIYGAPGWRNIPTAGWHYVYAHGVVGDNLVLAHSNSEEHSLDIKWNLLNTLEVFDHVCNIPKITPNAATGLELILFLHISLMTTLFEEAGHPLSFLMGIIGVTNSRKTSLALAITKIFNRRRLIADAEFATATNCGIEKILGNYKDAVVIVDDFKPGVNSSQQRFMNQKLDELVRLEGNRVTKKRMTDFMPDGDKKFFPIYGACLITMELVDGVQSTLSRMFLSEISNDDVDNNLLAVYQKNLWIIPTHVYGYVDWLTHKFSKVVEFIEKRFGVWRDKNVFLYARYSEMFAFFMVTAEIFGHYACSMNFWNDDQFETFIQYVEKQIVFELNKMAVRTSGKDKSKFVVRALQNIIIKKKLDIIELTSNTSSSKKEVYEDEKYLYIRAVFLRKLIQDYGRESYEALDIASLDELFNILEKLNLIVTRETNSGRERTHKLPIQKGNNLRYLYIKKETLSDIFEE